MARSMTGYGRAEATTDYIKFTVEIKTVNQRFLEISLKAPRQYSFIEEDARRLVQDKLSRGRVDVIFFFEDGLKRDKKITVDKELALAYHKALEELKNYLNLDNNVDLSYLSCFPDILQVSEQEIDTEELKKLIVDTLSTALENLIKMREIEGEKLSEDIIHRIEKIEQFIDEIGQFAPTVVEEYRKRLTQRLDDFLQGSKLDENRLNIECAIFADRSNINEELTRLLSHLQQFKKTLALQEPIGRKLDFILQEMNREINTIGSKANDYNISSRVVEVKSELEKVREQIQNIE